ncbi:Cobalt transport protein [Candidatus Accumulibacter aalborgensis]|uniref:Cobalt transport protein n=1 Tax=Candidatus Accumulibacter aalborgensis TaxID=1860102 RepID=A0A1A8XCZ4_9PROT|nr:cobalt ECF transporter T component CbiQ [Candidatus Accumulibacter aalborgensis]SBT03084.1 Cobalt transport protein [Candidatus Accumulibacter aalborgensis]
MLIEQSAYANRWRKASPAAKGIFALGGFCAAFAAGAPAAAVVVALLIAAATLAGAGIPSGRYLRAVTPAFFFLGISCLSLAFSLRLDDGTGELSLALTPSGMQKVAEVSARSIAALTALLFLVLTTPLTDLIALFRRLKTPEVLLEIMVLCYRMLFVLSAAVHDTLSAQSARLGYATPRLAIRSLGGLAANLTLQVWQRAHALHMAAQARNNDGPLRFLEPVFANSGRDAIIATAAGSALVALAVGWS